jgi:hypothetical protein
MVHLIPSRQDYKARQVAELMFEQIYKLHGVPKNIISDRDSLFTSVFWKHLHELIGTKLRMSSAYHPQSDGATERANKTLTQMLRQCVDPKQKDWVSKLPAIEFAINSARSAATGYAPFFLNTGRMPRSMIWDSAKQAEYPGVRTFALQRKLALMAAHDSILATRVKEIRTANKKRQLAPFEQNELVYVSTKNMTFPKGLARKLVPKFIGPYKILEDLKNQSFVLDLPSYLKQRGIHNVFHAALLRPHVPNDDRLFPGRLDMQLGNTDASEGKWAVDVIETHAGAKENAVFLVKWKSGDKTWLPYYQITHLNALTEYFELQGIEKIEYLREGTGQPPKDDLQNYIGALQFSRGCAYKRIPSRATPPRARRTIFIPLPPISPIHHAPSNHQSTPCLPRPSPATCQPCVLSSAHERVACRHSRRPTTGLPSFRPGIERRSAAINSTIRVPPIRDYVQRPPQHNRELGNPRRCRSCSSRQPIYHAQPIQRG